MMVKKKRSLGCLVMEGTVVFLAWGTASAFSQKSLVTPIGHEYLTVAPAHDLAEEFAELKPDKENWVHRAKCSGGCDRYGTQNFAIWSTVMGQRWVDIMGFRVGPTFPDQTKCFDAVAQLSESVQYDHFLRTSKDIGAAVRKAAIERAVNRFRQYFHEALRARDDRIQFSDGGGGQSIYQAKKSFFLFGRAAHLFQDSFSLEHAVRDKADGFTTVRDMKSYICTKGSQQHAHKLGSGIKSAIGAGEYSKHGDVIWTSRVDSLEYNNLKPHAQAAYRAMQDLWRAFILARRKPAEAEKLIGWVVNTWMQPGKAPPPTQSPTRAEEKDCAALELHKVQKRINQCLAVTGENREMRGRPPFSWETKIFPSID